MLVKPTKYDEIEVNMEFERLELGGHKGVIVSAVEYTNNETGNKSLKVEVDTSSDDKQPNYFRKQFDANTNVLKKWATGATKYVSLKEDENCVKMLKAFLTSVEKSNAGFTFDWGKEVDQLKGKKVGLVFGLEEYQDNEGKTRKSTKLVQFRSLENIENVLIPKVKLLNGSYVDYDDYEERQEEKQETASENDTIQIDEFILD